MAINTVEDLYREILGREPDAGGLAYWQQGFGDTIDPNEVASFKQAAQAELANRPVAEQQVLAPNLVNTPKAPVVQARAAQTQVSQPKDDYVATATAAPVTTVEDLYREVLGREPDAEGLAYWQQGFGNSVDAAEKASFLKAAQGELANRSAKEQALLAPKIVDTSATKVTDADILGWFNANPGADDATIAKVMQEAGVTPEQMARAKGTNTATTAAVDLSKATDLKNGTFLTPTGAIVNSEGNKVRDTGSAATATLTNQILNQNITDKWTGKDKPDSWILQVEWAQVLLLQLHTRMRRMERK